MKSCSIPKSNWDGQLPPHIAKNADIWWDMFPSVRPILSGKILGLFGGAKESPSRETIGKIVLIADIKNDKDIAPLLNDWGCFCVLRKDRISVTYDYMAGGLNVPPNLIFDVHWGLFGSVIFRFIYKVDQSLKVGDNERYEFDKKTLETSKEMGIPIDKTSVCSLNISKYQPGSWEHGLDIAFKAAIWLFSNREEALVNIWNTHYVINPMVSVSPLVSVEKPITFPIEGMSDSEIAESDAFLKTHDFTIEFANKNREMARQLMRQHLTELVKENQNNGYWVYYLLGDLLSMNGQIDEAIAIYIRATKEYPNDPRALYSLGTIYYVISGESDRIKISQRDLTNAPIEIQQMAAQDREFEKQNWLYLQGCSKSKLVSSPVEDANLALTYFRKTLACNISNEDRAKVQTHMRLIEAWKKVR